MKVRQVSLDAVARICMDGVIRRRRLISEASTVSKADKNDRDVVLRTVSALKQLDLEAAADLSKSDLQNDGPRFQSIRRLMITVHTKIDDLMTAVRLKRDVPNVVPNAAIELAAALMKMAAEFDLLMSLERSTTVDQPEQED